MKNVQAFLDQHQERFINELKEFVSIPSVSAIPEHNDDVVAAANWVVKRLISAGVENVSTMETGGHPAVYGDWLNAGPSKPTILIYGHFDVQPADPIELWDTNPFDAVVRDGKIFGRGACDDKGSMLTPIIAFETLMQLKNHVPINIKFLFEGQEEISSPQMPDFVKQNKNKLSCDMLFSADGGQWSETQPEVVVALKGILGFELQVTGPKSDQHSGLQGGAIANPLMALCQVISSMKDEQGKITIDGFYDDVLELSLEERTEISKIPFSDEDYRKEMDVDALFGERGFSTLERMWARPTLDVNGIWGGFQGDGTKTVHPSKAYAKITCRLVANQDPETVFDLIKTHVISKCPTGVKLVINEYPGSGTPFQVPKNHDATKIVKEVLKEVYNREPYITRVGGSIPIVSIFLKELGVHTAMLAFGLSDENIHAPNEFFRLSSFKKGQLAYCNLYNRLGVI